jgi:hypothetical protein
MSKSLLDSAAQSGFMTKIVREATSILENMLHYHSQCQTDRAPHTSTKKINFVEEVESLNAKLMF